MDNHELKQALSAAFTTSLIHFALVAFVVVVCTWAFLPFMPIMLWALVLAIALHPLCESLQSKLNWSTSRAATIIALAGVLLLGVPSAMLGNSFATKILGTYQSLEAGTLVVPEPEPGVADWPVVGEDLHTAWSDAADDLPGFLDNRQPQIKGLLSWLVDGAGSAARTVFLLIGAFIIAGIMLAWAGPAELAMRRIFTSFSDANRGPQLQALTTKTIRQVAVGIIGIAFVTAMTFGFTMVLAGIPAAPLLTLVALVFAIVQLPVTLIALVAVGLLWSGQEASTLHNAIFTVLMIAASLIDNFLKPLVLGRGLDVPMPVVLIGAIGGMMSGGILGMFIGAAFLAAGYQVFMSWVELSEHP